MNKITRVLLATFLLAVLCLVPVAKSQVSAATTNNFSARTVSTVANEAFFVHAADVDGDGDIDLMSASKDDDKIAWYENRGGQFALATADTAPTNLVQGQTDDLLKITATHQGRIGDADMELATFELLFEESGGDTLTTAEANAIIANLHIYLDDGSGVFAAGSDTLVATVADLALIAGKQTVTFADSDANVQVVYGTPRAYFVVAELTSDAASQTPNQFRITHLTASSSTAEDRDYDLPLTMEYVANAPSGVMTASATAPPPAPTPTVEPSEPIDYMAMNVLGTRKNYIFDSSGRIQRMHDEVHFTSPDDMLTVTIFRNTEPKDSSGDLLLSFDVSVNEAPPPPPENGNIIGLPYEFKPEGATFDPPLGLTMMYDPASLPAGVSEEDLVIAYYDADAAHWVECSCTCDMEHHYVTAYVCHFTSFAIIAYQPPPAPAAFSLSNLSIQPAEVQPGETVTVTVTITNTGGMEGVYSFILEVDDVEEAVQEISVAAGSTPKADFKLSRGEPGDYLVKVDGLEGSFTVITPPTPPPPLVNPKPAPTPQLSPPPSSVSQPTSVAPSQAPPPPPPYPPVPPPSDTAINWILIGGVATGALLVGWFVFSLLRRRYD